jgi:hypothetical protein
MNPDTNRKLIEELIMAGDPYALASMIVDNKFSDVSEEELRELLARAFSNAAHLERQANGLPAGGFGEPEEYGGAAKQLDTMALDLRYNPGQLKLIDQIYLFYPNLKSDKTGEARISSISQDPR